MRYDRITGRIRVRVTEEGARDHSYGHGAYVECPAGWNEDCPVVTLTMSVEELHDLRYLLDRAITHARK